MKKFTGVLFAVVVLVLVLGRASIRVQAQNTDDETIETGIYIGNVDVSGLTEEEAARKIQEYIDQIGEAEITLNAMTSVPLGSFVSTTRSTEASSKSHSSVIN